MLVIVESPTKAKKIQSFLGKGYTVKASLGHVRDLPPDEFAVSIEALEQGKFPFKFKVLAGKGRVVKELQRLASGELVLCASDPDREGEAIAWHLAQLLKEKAKEVKRIEFHEITKKALQEAVKRPREIDLNRVRAQFARRAIDRILGYLISPELSKELGKRGLSAGRVQSTALAEIVKREREIKEFVPKPYWVVEVELEKDGKKFRARTEKFWDKKEAQENLRFPTLLVIRADKRKKLEKPKAPFTASALQQEANRLFKWSPEYTMKVAQELFENGYITYHRSDSPRLSEEAVGFLRNLIPRLFGKDYLPAKPFVYKAKEGAQDAHEAIRPTKLTPEGAPENLKDRLTPQQLKLYTLIWKRTLASQMKEAVWNTQTVVLQNDRGVKFTAKGKTLVFEGWRKVYDAEVEEDGEGILPELRVGEKLPAKLRLKEDKTKPPARYTEGSLVKWLEKTGVGRPSTYASTVKTLKARKYVVVKGGKMVPTETAFRVIEFLEEKHPWILSPELTAQMEKQLDLVEQGKLDWRKPVLETVEKVRELLPLLSEERDDRPTEKQLEFARSLAEKLKKELPADVLLSKKKLSKWIDGAKRELAKEKANAPLSEKQVAVIEKHGDEKVREALLRGDYAYCRKWLDGFFRELKRSGRRKKK
ncbi:DNA topoisomerase I (plasmid) [Thermovibrio ammonificans HB-1]|uniref:DNA topoisomerase 1 n=1 Tax=Thermovibrio ammonificans (strain DSM 15698 / JCM 12110 / HB-1) TaxID=648996 RepID=E8T6Y3_THEA1|nr:type I DNA topoisomerase [Thermovibrio ammonificans]ADU97704.1 DNA topoisomerase I [Thermovibrio ammonificans HB-1]